MSGTSYQSLWVSKNVYIYQTLIFWFGPLNLKTRKKRKKNPTKHWICQAVSLSFKTCLQTFIFWSGPLNLETGKKRKKNPNKTLNMSSSIFEFQNMFTNIHFLVWSFESGNWKEKEKKQNTGYLKNKKSFLVEIKNIFIIFEMLSFAKI